MQLKSINIQQSFISFADAKRDKETVVSTIRTQIQNQWDKYNFVFENLKGIDDAISFLMERMEGLLWKRSYGIYR